MGKKGAIRPAQQVLNANLVNKFGAARSSNALDAINFSSIKCHVCARTRPVDCYSNRQLLKHKNTIHNPYIPSGRSLKDYATCKDCTAAQVDKIHCFICNVDKPIESFLKTQRSEAKPRCKACVQYCLDTERVGAAPNRDDYYEDSSDESNVDHDESIDDNLSVNDTTAKVSESEDDSDADVDGGPVAKKVGGGTGTASVSRQMATMNLQDTPSGTVGNTTPNMKTREGSTPASRATPARMGNPDNDVNDSGDGGWVTVGTAGKTNSAYRTPTWASITASGVASPAATSTASYSTGARTTVPSGSVTPATTAQYSSTGRKKWGKPAKLKPGEVVEDVWMSKTATKNEWKAYGGQPKMAKVKKSTRTGEEEDENEDDGEE